MNLNLSPDYQFTIRGNPIAWNRPARAKGGHTFDSQYQEKGIFLLQIPNDQFPVREIALGEVWDKGIVVEMLFYFMPPSSLSRKKREGLIGTHKITKPDLDNLIKFILDTLEGSYFTNDSRVIEFGNSTRLYDWIPRTEIKIWRIF